MPTSQIIMALVIVVVAMAAGFIFGRLTVPEPKIIGELVSKEDEDGRYLFLRLETEIKATEGEVVSLTVKKE